MTNDDILAMLKANLEIVNGIHDSYLRQLIEVSKVEIAREGITLNDSINDTNLVIMYAAYLYRDRVVDTKTVGQYNTAAFSAQGMPRMLRYALNNRLLSEKMGK